MDKKHYGASVMLPFGREAGVGPRWCIHLTLAYSIFVISPVS